MRTIIAGTRKGIDKRTFDAAMMHVPWEITVVLSGGAMGVDRMGEKWAEEHDLPLDLYPANWDLHGKAAGPIRNARMAENADALVAFWDGESRGTKNMIDEAKKRELKVMVVKI
jgi:hypothetical protein